MNRNKNIKIFILENKTRTPNSNSVHVHMNGWIDTYLDIKLPHFISIFIKYVYPFPIKPILNYMFIYSN